MNRKILLLILPLIFLQCSTYEPKHETENKPNLDSLNTTITNSEQVSEIDSIPNNKVKIEEKCNCKWKFKGLKHRADLKFSNNARPYNLDSLNKWKDNPARLDIKSLRLIDFDTIPSEMSIFENVESVYLDAIGNHNIQGLEVFPKLRNLRAEEERFEINENSKWIKNIEVIHANKTKFSGLKSFKQMPNLKEVKLSFSGFDTFPSDFENLKCLTYFQTGAHTSGEIDLSKLNLKDMKCLESIEFQSWRKNLHGIPMGINHIKTVKISHPNLTKTEKEKLK